MTASRRRPRRLAVRIAEVAVALSCAPRTIQRLIRRGDLKVLKVGRSTRVVVSSFDAFVARGGSRQGRRAPASNRSAPGSKPPTPRSTAP